MLSVVRDVTPLFNLQPYRILGSSTAKLQPVIRTTLPPIRYAPPSISAHYTVDQAYSTAPNYPNEDRAYAGSTSLPTWHYIALEVCQTELRYVREMVFFLRAKYFSQGTFALLSHFFSLACSFSLPAICRPPPINIEPSVVKSESEFMLSFEPLGPCRFKCLSLLL